MTVTEAYRSTPTVTGGVSTPTVSGFSTVTAVITTEDGQALQTQGETELTVEG